MNGYVEVLPVDAANEISRRVGVMMDFWQSSRGWAPIEAANLLDKAMLGWQKSLAACLPMWIRDLSEGELILAWVNLGALVEGQLKLFLSVFYLDYAKNINFINTDKKGRLKDPSVLSLEPLRLFFRDYIWEKHELWDEWIYKIQLRRNAIHAFQYRSIGDVQEFQADVVKLLSFIQRIDDQIPYPDVCW